MASSQVEIAPFVSIGCLRRRDQSHKVPDRFSNLRINTIAGGTREDFSSSVSRHDVSLEERESSPSHSESSAEIPNHGGVSSLVKKWKDLSGERHNGEDSSSQPPPESLDDDRVDAASTTPPTTDSAVRESERLIKVADVIRKLTTESDDNEFDHRRLLIPEQRQFFSSPLVNSPRIRGRQALTNLLMRLEKERRSEVDGLLKRRPVSNFPHKGKIQALLRLRFLHRKAVNRYQDHLNNPIPIKNNLLRGKEEVRRQSESHLSETVGSYHHHGQGDSTISERMVYNPTDQHCLYMDSKTPEYSSIVTLRDRFNHGIESELTNPKRPRTDLVNKYVANLSTSSLHIVEVKEPTSLEVKIIEELPGTSSHQNSNVYSPEDILGLPDENKQRTTEENRFHLNCQDLSTSSSNEHVGKEEEWKEVHNQIIVDTKDEDSSGDTSQSKSEFEDEDDGVNWQEVGIVEQQGANCNWANEICRPISDWEDLRRARYDEMLDSFNRNQDIKHLLERRSVSNFLFSNLRQKIDQLMISRSNMPCNQLEEPLSLSRTEQHVTSQIPGEMHVSESGQEGGSSDDRICCYKNPSITGSESGCSIRSCDEVNDSSNPDDEFSPTTSQSSILDTTCHSSFPSQTSMEMELIHDLREHMIQLQREMSKLKKSMKYCMEMQASLQSSVKQEVVAAVKQEVATMLSRSGICEEMGVAASKEKEKGSSPNQPGKGICCICKDMQVDSLLYRCGHMCACLECARQLQREGGKCPVCSSPILDVIRPSLVSIHS